MLRRLACALVPFAGCFIVQAAVAQPLLSPSGAAPLAPNLPAAVIEPPSGETLPAPPNVHDDQAISPVLPELIRPPADAEPAWYAPVYLVGGRPWDTSIEFGLNGSSGTSDSLSIQAGGSMLRESRFSKFDLDTKYNRTTKGGSATQNNAELDVRNDWLLDDTSPWTLYATGNLFYDEFQAFDLQTSGNTGVGYRFIHQPTRELIGRFGGGASREIGGPDNRWVPESLVAAEYMQRLNALQKVTAKVDYYPEWEEIGEFRLLADVAWETALVQPSNMSLKLSASDRYDSTPGGADPHLVNYSVLLLMKM